MVGKCVFGQVRLEAVAVDDAFCQVRAEWNRLRICRAEGPDIHVVGRGAGRWATTEAVIADLFDIRFAKLASAYRLVSRRGFLMVGECVSRFFPLRGIRRQ
jgi:homoserine dehydrogenase